MDTPFWFGGQRVLSRRWRDQDAPSVRDCWRRSPAWFAGPRPT